MEYLITVIERVKEWFEQNKVNKCKSQKENTR